MKKNTDERIYYDTTPSQDVVILQCKYTLFRRIVNIVCSMDTKEKIDWDIMEQAMYLTIVRNDCLRLKFVKKGGKLVQYFDKPEPVKVTYKKFSTKKEELLPLNLSFLLLELFLTLSLTLYVPR